MTPNGSSPASSRLLRRSGGSGPEDATAYDFRRPSKLSREDNRALQLAFETFARRLTTQLTTGLRQVCQVNLVAIEQQTYEEYIGGLNQTTILAVLDLDPWPGTGILEFSVPTALACVDYLLGGPGGEQPTRPLTDIETPLLRGLIEQMLGVLTYALEPTELAPVLERIEYNPQFLQASSSTDIFVVGSFEMHIGNQTCLATLCMPLTTVMPRLNAKAEKPSTVAEREAAARHTARLRTAVSGAPIQVSVRFASIKLTPDQIVSLTPGDVLPLNHRVTTPLAVEAGGGTFAHALAGRSGSRLAGLVVATPKEK
ncbi:flagellar motor switch protein FliM [Jatrophihabitans telluris]|uniref:Flagellar motor switch protein FliM n=1 Tax=Jatrophihabitans telluris TaxID=2038343 RepID=A0ABY4QWA0_9ACTN|nr:flagellar motor switch protein FliM [Jatrophihabitans telluris]UQX87963.1 flagellar motor switch protein FliM [Jatrophihabitans telluris]